jgi:hypothetical protein
VCLFLFGLLIAIMVARQTSAGTQLVMIALELLLPPIIGMVAAGLLAGDAALDLLLSVPTPAPYILLRRLAVLLVFLVVLAGLVQGLSGLWTIQLPVKGAAQLLIWTTPSLLYVGLGTAAALVRGRMLDGVGAVMGVWVMTLITISMITDLCAPLQGQSCAAAVVSPAMSYFRSQDPNWPLNRVGYAVVGIALICLGLFLSSNEERLIDAAYADGN